MAFVKICGLNDSASVDAALAGAARYIGFIFFEKSPRHIAPARAAALAAPIGEKAFTVAVTVDAADETLAVIAETLAPDFIQAHGSESPARLGELRRFARRGVIRALPVAGPEDLAAVAPAAAAADLLLFDAKAPQGADRPGGHGAVFDWKILAGRKFARPWMLSGGLTPENLPAAIAASGAPGVDVSSGVEISPGVKDPLRISSFLTAARAAPSD